jgi:hypothetical protein
MATESFTCAHVTGWLPDYVAGRLGLTELALIEMHLAQCATCRQALQGLASGADRTPPRIRHRRWRPGRLIVPAASTVARAIAGVVASRPRFPGSLRTAVPAIRRGAPSLQSDTSMLQLTASTVRADAPSVPSVPFWLQRPPWRLPLEPSPGAMESLVRIGSTLVALALVGGVWWLPAPNGLLAPVPGPPAPASVPAPLTAPMVTTAEPAVGPEVATPAPLVSPPPRAPSPRPTQSPDRRPAPSPAPDSAIPPPEWIPAGRPRPDAPTGARAPTPEAQVQPAPSSPDTAAAVDWLLRGDGRGTRSPGRAETP